MAAPEPFTARKAIISVLMVGWLVVLLVSLERKYDESDYRKVDRLMVAPGAPWSLEKELLERNPGNAPRCEKALTSSFRGLVAITCTASGVDPWRFEADLVRMRIRGLDPRSVEVMAAVEEKVLRARDAGTPPPPPPPDAGAPGGPGSSPGSP